MRWYLLTIFVFVISLLGAQNQTITFDGDSRNIENTEPFRQIFDEGIYGVQVIYQFPGAVVNPVVEGNMVFQQLYITNFSHSQEFGKASLPSHIDLVIIPSGATPSIQLINVDTAVYNNFLVYPALLPASDEYGATEPEFVFDSSFYASGAFYPSSPVVLREVISYKGFDIALIEVFPIQYLPSARKLYVHSEISYKVNFTQSNSFITNQNASAEALKILPNYVINNQNLKIEIQQYINNLSIINTDPNYLIITHPDYKDAADSLAEWKRQMGFKPEIITSSNWTSSSITAAIQDRYQNYTPTPDYFVILGDNDKVPGQVINYGGATYATDLYYGCMDGSNDFVPDMAFGRISVINPAQAMMVVKKIINYEKYPIVDSVFYSTGLNCAYFQHAGNGYAERRFAQTSEEIRNHIVSYGYNVERVYKTGSSVNPLYWNNGYYSAGESIPNYLKKPSFAWNGNASNINSNINEGRFFVFHRDHGMSSGWGDPYYTSSNVNTLVNGNKLPIVFSVNCLTGKYMDAECFAEKFLRMPNGGAVGVFGHGEVSYSGYNDGLALGLVDAIWSNPGLVPTFSGSGGVTNPTLSAHTNLYRLGDIKNQGLIRMIETWGGNTADIKYTHELLNYFGDPAMEIFTAQPVPIYAMANDTIDCHTDTLLSISNCSFDGMATLVCDGELIAKADIVNGSALLLFNTISGNNATLTITGHNKIPLIKDIIIIGGCPKARFTAQSDKFCLSDSVLITDFSTGIIAARQWNFGNNAIPSVAVGQGPFYVKYLTSGQKTVNLVVTDSNNLSVNYQKNFIIDQYCRYSVPSTGNITVDKCSGMLYDDGGMGNYSDNTSGSFTISPSGASSITLSFQSFQLENSYDYVKIYDGPNTNSNLIGTYTGSTLPNNGQISSTQGSITIEQQSDSYVNYSGFSLTWQCSYPNTSPICDFTISDSITCDGIIQFYDYSINGPSNYLWDFGDGITSTQKNPEHIYSFNGIYSVKLVVSNSYGFDSIVKNSLVTVLMPNTPLASDGMRCKSGTIDLTANYQGNGTLWWFDSPSSKNPIDTGLIFTTPHLTHNSTYYAEVHEQKNSLVVGKSDNTGPGGYYTSSSVHYLVFDAYKNFKLKSVLVYSSTAGNRTISLLNSGGSLLMSKTVNIPAGQSRVQLDFDVPVGINLRLAGPGSPNLYRNSGGTNYPYEIDNIVTIKHSSATSAPTNYYYYFYDWEIVEGECVSPRISVNALILDTLKPITDFAISNADPKVSFTYTGDFATIYYWDFGDGDFSILENPNHLYKSNGTFNVSLTTTNGCGQTHIVKQVIIISANLQTSDIFNKFLIYPIPTRNLLNVEMNLLKSESLKFNILDVAGRQIISGEFDAHAGENSTQVDVSNLAQGFYTITYSCGDGIVVRKFIIE